MTCKMVFKCQEDSFLKEFTSKVVYCEQANLDVIIEGKKVSIDGFDVKLEDTILFPEGGGQPCDYGLINNVKVLQVRREGSEAIHFTTLPLSIDEDAHQVVDWVRRFDHMQQHSGQHLLSAVLERDYGYNTDSWWLGEDVCFVEADTSSFSKADIAKTEKIINDYICQALPVVVKVYKAGDPELKKASTRGLPADHKGDIRVISIGNIDSNMCCGTHVRNLNQLQMIKILYAEKGKRKNKTNIYFMVGNRVLKCFTECLDREHKLTSLLNNAPNMHVELVEKLQKNLKAMNKNMQIIMKDMAYAEAEKIKKILPPLKYFSTHRKDADMDFFNNFIRALDTTKILLFFTCGDEKGSGFMLLHGDSNAVAELGPKLCELLEGKGAGKGNRFQAKVTNLTNRHKCDERITEYFAA